MDKKNLFSIGKVAKMFHLSTSTLRHYENIGLLSPAYISSESGYRYYSTEQFEILNMVRYLRTLDMPLSEIENFLKNREIESMEKKLRQQKEIVIKKQEELKRIEQKIEHQLNRLKDAQSVELDKISLIKMPELRIVWMYNPLKIEGFLDMEIPIRKMDKSDVEAVVFLGKVGVGISEEHLRTGQVEEYDGTFLVLDKEDIYSGKTSILPETLCARIRFRGSHPEAGEQYKKLLDYIEKEKLQITGFSREMALIDNGVTNDRGKFVTEICIPVKVNQTSNY